MPIRMAAYVCAGTALTSVTAVACGEPNLLPEFRPHEHSRLSRLRMSSESHEITDLDEPFPVDPSLNIHR